MLGGDAELRSEDGLVRVEVDGVFEERAVPDVVAVGAKRVLVFHEHGEKFLARLGGQVFVDVVFQKFADAVLLGGGMAAGRGLGLLHLLLNGDLADVVEVVQVVGCGDLFSFVKGPAGILKVGEGRREMALGVRRDDRAVALVVVDDHALPAVDSVAVFVDESHEASGDSFAGRNNDRSAGVSKEWLTGSEAVDGGSGDVGGEGHGVEDQVEGLDGVHPQD